MAEDSKEDTVAVLPGAPVENINTYPLVSLVAGKSKKNVTTTADPNSPDYVERIPLDNSIPILATVIMSALNEEYVDKTVNTLLEVSGDKLHEIVIIDDFSDIPIAEQYPDFASNDKIRIIRNSERQGLIRSRNIGAQASSTAIVISMDPHCKAADGWLDPIIDRLSDHYRCIGVPLTRGLDAKNWVETSNPDAKTGWRWNLDFFWRKDDGSDESPAFAGHCFAFTKKWWEESGKLDDGMYKWGGENIEFAIRTWLCGGSVEIIRDSVVAHFFKSGFCNYEMDGKTLNQNKLRIAAVWFEEEHKNYFHTASGLSRSRQDYGDVSERLAIKERLQIKTMDWYLRRFQPELYGIYTCHNRHRGANIAVLGAGPSLDDIPRAVLDSYDVIIGVNYNALYYNCDYVVFHDIGPAEKVLNSNKYKPEQLLVPITLKDGTGKPHTLSQNVCKDWLVYELGPQDQDKSLKNKLPPLFHHASTVHTGIHFAAFLGAKSVTLFGCDVQFAPDGRSHAKFDEYRKGFYWPDNKGTQKYMARINRGYDMLRESFKKHDIPLIRYDYV